MSSQAAHVIKNHYVIQRVLGNGRFGRVHLAYDRQRQRRCAIKEICLTTESRTKLACCPAWSMMPGSLEGAGQYIIVMMSQDLPDATAGQHAIATVSETVYAWFSAQ